MDSASARTRSCASWTPIARPSTTCTETIRRSSRITRSSWGCRRRQPFGMMMPQERLQHLAVGREAIRPEVMTHQLAGGLELLVHERQCALACRGVLELLEAFSLGPLERLEHRRRQPGMLLHQGA